MQHGIGLTSAQLPQTKTTATFNSEKNNFHLDRFLVLMFYDTQLEKAFSHI